MKVVPRVLIIIPHGVDSIRLAHAAMYDSMERGEAPFVPYLHYTQCLLGNTEEVHGLEPDAAYKAWAPVSDKIVFYATPASFGMPPPLTLARDLANKHKKDLLYRTLEHI